MENGFIFDNERIVTLKKRIDETSEEISKTRKEFFKKEGELHGLQKELNDTYVSSLLGQAKGLVGLCYKKLYDDEWRVSKDKTERTEVHRYFKILDVNGYGDHGVCMTVAIVVPEANSFKVTTEYEDVSVIVDGIVSNDEYNAQLGKVSNFLYDLSQGSDMKDRVDKKYFSFCFI